MNLANVLIIEDELFIQASLKSGLKSFGINVVDAVNNAFDAFTVLEKEKVDVALVDLDLGPGPNGIDICYSLRKKFNTLGLIILSSYTNPAHIDNVPQALPKGCKFISKSNLSEYSYLVNEILYAKIKPLQSKENSFSKNTILTPNQLEVLKLVSEGLSSIEIASRKGVSVKAIEASISKIHKTLKLSKSKSLNQRVQLARAYFKLAGKKPPGE